MGLNSHVVLYLFLTLLLTSPNAVCTFAPHLSLQMPSNLAFGTLFTPAMNPLVENP